MGCSAVLSLLYTIIVFSKNFSVTITDVVLSDDACLTDYFYNGFPPIYLNEYKHDTFICQKKNTTTYFVTRYSTLLKIPIYSAYQIKNLFINSTVQKMEKISWTTEKSLELSQQATKADYKHSGYDRGHLNPKSHNLYSQKSLETTFSLTNAVPMLNTFNTKWHNFAEDPLYTSITNNCKKSSYKRYIITGVIPGNEQMKQTVNIPEYVWSAALCIDENGQYVWSVGYWLNATNFANFGKAIPIQNLEKDLQKILKEHKFKNTTVRLFQDLPIYNQQKYSMKNPTRRSRSCSVSSIAAKRNKQETGRK